MKSVQFIFLTIVLTIALTSCKKQGCTDCNAFNFNVEASEDDLSCQYLNEAYLGTYAVDDSVTGPPTLDWFYNSYEIVIKRANCAPNRLIISNYANMNNNFSGDEFNIVCKIDNSTLSIIPQQVPGKYIRNSTGYFTADSINFAIEYENEFGEVFYGNCYGKKL